MSTHERIAWFVVSIQIHGYFGRIIKFLTLPAWWAGVTITMVGSQMLQIYGDKPEPEDGTNNATLSYDSIIEEDARRTMFSIHFEWLLQCPQFISPSASPTLGLPGCLAELPQSHWGAKSAPSWEENWCYSQQRLYSWAVVWSKRFIMA